MDKGYLEMNILCKIHAVKATTLRGLEDDLLPNAGKRRQFCEVTLLLKLNSKLPGSRVGVFTTHAGPFGSYPEDQKSSGSFPLSCLVGSYTSHSG